MAGFMGKVSRLARSEQGRRMMEQAQRVARDPATRRKITEARERLGRKRAG